MTTTYVTPPTVERMQNQIDAAKADNVRLMSRIEKLEAALIGSTALLMDFQPYLPAGYIEARVETQIDINRDLLGGAS